MSIFEKKFSLLLEQPPMADMPTAEGPSAEPGVPEENPMVEPGVVDDVGANPSISWRAEANQKQKGTIGEWISKIEEMNEFLNGVTDGSMQAQLNNADCDTLFNSVSRSETKKISRIAQDLSGLVESLKGYLLSSEDS
tara:strand:- start:165 stop:578 length:414 start_codon:yes stop_codon:yes gene_type:complete